MEATIKTNSILTGVLVILTLTFLACTKSDQPQAEPIDKTPTAVVNFDVQGMTCTGCEANVKMALKNVEGVKDVEASYSESSAKVVVNPETVDDEKIVEALDKIGYTAKKKESC